MVTFNTPTPESRGSGICEFLPLIRFKSEEISHTGGTRLSKLQCHFKET